MSYHSPILPAPAAQTRADGWSSARQRRFIETLADTGVIMLACESVRITARSAYNLRNRRDGAAFRLGWDAAILIARARLADTLLARAIMGNTDTIRRDEDNFEVTRHRHDNRLAMSMLARLDRMADCPTPGSDAALARVVAQDFAAYLDMICPEEQAIAEAEEAGLPRPGAEHSARDMEDARMLDGSMPDTPAPLEEQAAAALSPGASAALFVAARMALHRPAQAEPEPSQQRCELRPEPEPEPQPDPQTLPPQEAVFLLRGVWWDEYRRAYRTDFPAPPGFEGLESGDFYDIAEYDRELSPEEEAAFLAWQEEVRRPYVDAAAEARDAYFGFTPPAAGADDGDGDDDETEADDPADLHFGADAPISDGL